MTRQLVTQRAHEIVYYRPWWRGGANLSSLPFVWSTRIDPCSLCPAVWCFRCSCARAQTFCIWFFLASPSINASLFSMITIIYPCQSLSVIAEWSHKLNIFYHQLMKIVYIKTYLSFYATRGKMPILYVSIKIKTNLSRAFVVNLDLLLG